jgi:hypothetical protein
MTYYHPDGLTVDIVHIIASDCGHSCKDHPFCGEIVALDVVVWFCCEMIHIAGGADGGLGREEPAIVMLYWVTNGIDPVALASFLGTCFTMLPVTMVL